MALADVDRSASRSPKWSLYNQQQSQREHRRAPSNQASSSSASPLTRTHIEHAVKTSPDDGVTLVFMKKNIGDIGQEAAEELTSVGKLSPDEESRVERIALGSNRLSTLPMEFSLLTRLRYLNLKNNNFSEFPEVLTLMPSLDTLDISHNRIKKLPVDPGHLVKLRVFCCSRNKIGKLPEYLPQFQQLTVLEVDRNPLEWPPVSAMARPAKFATPEAMKQWIRGLQKWIENETTPASINLDDLSIDELEDKLRRDFRSWSRFPLQEPEIDEVTPHARSFSIDSTLSESSAADSDVGILSPVGEDKSTERRRMPLHLGILRTNSTEVSPTRSFGSYLPSPADSESFFEDDSSTASAKQIGEVFQRQQISFSEAGPSRQHFRAPSYLTNGSSSTPRQVEAIANKSMPDLRTAKLNFTKKSLGDYPDRSVSTTALNRNKALDDSSMPSPLSQRQDSASSGSSVPRPHRMRSPSQAGPSMAFERNSYFRRISSLPTASISNILPQPLLSLVDTARSVLFATCQIYQSLEHYTVYSIDERLSSVLRKVLDPASADMMQFINALDRFDVMSRKAVPPPSICRGVVETCRETVASFSKAVGVLSLQLKVIAAGDDVRYLRSMLLVLYGASVDVSSAWSSMQPHIEAVKPYLVSRHFPAASPNGLQQPGSKSEPFPSQSPFRFDSPPPLHSLRSQSSTVVPSRHVGRRNAGSFSSKDVELGKKMPNIDQPPLPAPATRGVSSAGVRPARNPRRQATGPGTYNTPLSVSPMPSISDHIRSVSAASLQASSTASSPSTTSKSTPFVEASTSKTQVDQSALDAVQEAVDVAPKVWTMMETSLDEVLDAKPEAREALNRAKILTNRLAEATLAIRDHDQIANGNGLREDALAFVKTVVQLSHIVKSYGSHLGQLRQLMVKLTNATEEFAILLHVSSYSSTAAPTSPKPTNSAVTQPMLLGLPVPEDRGTGAVGISRSRSAQASNPPRPSITTVQGYNDGPRSALPSSSFKVPPSRLPRGRDDTPS